MAPLRRALVTGAEGFLGRHLVRELERHGTRVTGLVRHSRPGSPCAGLGDAPWQVESLADIIEGIEPDAVFHLVGAAAGTATRLHALNVGLARTVMDALQLAQARPLLVCCGSAAEYGSSAVDGVPTPEAADCEPSGAYGASKLAQTQAALQFGEATGRRVLVARLFNPIGPGMPPHLALGDFARQVAAFGPSGGTLLTGTLDVARDFLDVRVAVRALRLLAEHPDASGVVNVCSGRATRLAYLVRLLVAASGKPVRLEVDPRRTRPGEMRAMYGDPGLLLRLVGDVGETDHAAVVERIWRHAAAAASPAGAAEARLPA